MAQLVKNLPAMRETWIQSLGWEDPLEKRMATHSSILAWRIPWTVHRIAKSQTRLSDFHFHLYNHKCMQEYKEMNMVIPLKKKKKGPIELQTLTSELLQGSRHWPGRRRSPGSQATVSGQPDTHPVTLLQCEGESSLGIRSCV